MSRTSKNKKKSKSGAVQKDSEDQCAVDDDGRAEHSSRANNREGERTNPARDAGTSASVAGRSDGNHNRDQSSSALPDLTASSRSRPVDGDSRSDRTGD